MLRRSFLGLLALTPFATCSITRAPASIVTAGADILADRVTIGACPAGSRLPIFWAEVGTPESIRAALVDEAIRFERLGLLSLQSKQLKAER